MLKEFTEEGYKILRSVNNLKAVFSSIENLDVRATLYRIYNIIVGRKIASKLWLRKDRGLASALILAVAALGAIFLTKHLEEQSDHEDEET